MKSKVQQGSDYIQAQMRNAEYVFLDDNVVYGTIPDYQLVYAGGGNGPGFWGYGATQKECEEDLRLRIEQWVGFLVRNQSLDVPEPPASPDELPNLDLLQNALKQEHFIDLGIIKNNLLSRGREDIVVRGRQLKMNFGIQKRLRDVVYQISKYNNLENAESKELCRYR